MRKRKESLIMIVIITVLSLGLGYAYLNTTLSINGTTDVDSNTWNVYWDNVQVISGSVTGSQVIQAPTIDTNKTTVSFHIRLKEPGEYYEFTVDAKNDGTIDAVIDTITKTINNSTTVPNYLKFDITYDDYFPIEGEQILNTGTKETYRVRIEYNTDLNPNDLPSTAQSLSIQFGIDYTQAKSNTRVTRLYTLGQQAIGQPLNANISYYDNIDDLRNSWSGSPLSITIIAKDNIATDAYIRFDYNNRAYYLRVGGATYNESTGKYNEDSIYYESNIEVLKSAYGEEQCYYYTDDSESTTYYNCENNNTGSEYTSTTGIVGGFAMGYGYGCSGFHNGMIGCGG